MNRHRVLTQEYDWAAVSHPDLYRAVHDGNDPGEVGQVSAEWKALSTELAESADLIREAVTAAESGWEGETAQTAHTAMRELSDWTTCLAKSVALLADQVGQQGEIMATARATMPKPADFSYDEATKPFSSGSIPELTESTKDIYLARDHALSGHESAVAVMRTMEESSQALDRVTPQFSLPRNPVAGGIQDPVRPVDNLVRPAVPVTDGMMYIASAESPPLKAPEQPAHRTTPETNPASGNQQYGQAYGPPAHSQPHSRQERKRQQGKHAQDKLRDTRHKQDKNDPKPDKDGPKDKDCLKQDEERDSQTQNATPVTSPVPSTAPAPAFTGSAFTGSAFTGSGFGGSGFSSSSGFNAISGDLGGPTSDVKLGVNHEGSLRPAIPGGSLLGTTILPPNRAPIVPVAGPPVASGGYSAVDGGIPPYMPPMGPGFGGNQDQDGEHQARFLIDEDIFEIPGGELPPPVIGEDPPSPDNQRG